jgi:SAM-dependent methyltransferase
MIFDEKLLKQNQVRVAKKFANHNFLHHEIASRMAENLSLMNCEFQDVLELGAKDDYLRKLIETPSCDGVTKGENDGVTERRVRGEKINYQFCENDELINLDKKFDLIVSNLNFHFINEIPAFLINVKELLNKGGVFLASFFGEENLSELAHVLHKSEMEIYGGVSPRMAPTIDVKTAAMLLQKAGFNSPISDFEKIEVEYQKPIDLLKDLKFMGQGNVLQKRSRRFFSKRFLNKICENYFELYSTKNLKILASFEIVTIIGWK